MLNLDKKYTSFSELLEAAPRETIATVNGIALTIPVEVPLAIGMAYNRTRLNRGEDLAITWAFDLLVGTEGMSTLLESNASDDDWTLLTDIIVGRVRGATVGSADQAPKASPSGSPTTRKPAASRGRRAAAKS